MNVCAVRTYGSSWLEPRIASPRPHESDGRRFKTHEVGRDDGVPYIEVHDQFRCIHCGDMYMEDSK